MTTHLCYSGITSTCEIKKKYFKLMSIIIQFLIHYLLNYAGTITLFNFGGEGCHRRHCSNNFDAFKTHNQNLYIETQFNNFNDSCMTSQLYIILYRYRTYTNPT